MPPSVPDHELLRCIGRGSYGEVWLARNVLGTFRAVKVVYRDAFADARPYEREFEGIQKFEPFSRGHEGLVDVLQIGLNHAAAFFYYVMELADAAAVELRVAGQPEADATDRDSGGSDIPLRREGPDRGGAHRTPESFVASYSPRTLSWDLRAMGRLTFPQCLRIGLALADALDFLHGRGLIHRDIKPSNIIFVNGAAKLADIGLVTEFGTSRSWVGTEGFMPPEGPGTPQADVFSLGKVLYEMATGKDRQRFPEPLTALADLHDHKDWLEFNAVVEKACADDPRQRYLSAADLRADLALLVGGKSVRRWRTLERQRRYLGAAVAVVLAVGALALVMYQHFHEQALNRHKLKVEQASNRRLHLLREVRGLRSAIPTSGWSVQSWRRLKEAAQLGFDDEVKLEAAMCLSGLDAIPLLDETNLPASDVAFSPRGERVLFGGLDGQAMIWDGPGQPLRPTGPWIASGPVTWLPDGSPAQLAPVPADPFRWQLWDLSRSNVLREFCLPPISAPNLAALGRLAAFSVDGTRVAIGTRAMDGGGTVGVWNVEASPVEAQPADEVNSGRPDRGDTPALRLFDAAVTALALTPDGGLLAIGENTGRIHIWDVGTGRHVAEFYSGRMQVHDLAFARDNLRRWDDPPDQARWILASSHAGGDVLVWDASRSEVRLKFRGISFDAFNVAFAPDSTLLSASGSYRTVIWDVATASPQLWLVNNHTTTGLAFSPDGGRLATSARSKYASGKPHVFELKNGQVARRLRGLSTEVGRMRLSPDGRYAAALAHNWELAIWRLNSGRESRVLQVPPGDTADNAALTFSPDSRKFAFCAGTNAFLLDVESGAILRRWHLPPGFGDAIGLHPNGRIYLLRREPENFTSYESMCANTHPLVCRLRDLAPLNDWELPLFSFTNTAGAVSDTLVTSRGEWFAINRTARHSGKTNQVLEVFDCASLKLVYDRTVPATFNQFAWLDIAQAQFVVWLGPEWRALIDPARKAERIVRVHPGQMGAFGFGHLFDHDHHLIVQGISRQPGYSMDYVPAGGWTGVPPAPRSSLPGVGLFRDATDLFAVDGGAMQAKVVELQSDP